MLREQQERAQDRARRARERIIALDVQPFIAGDECGVDGARRHVGRREQPRLEVLQHDGIELRDGFGSPVVALHQQFTGAARGGGLEAHGRGHCTLHVEHEPVFTAASDDVQMRADILQHPLIAAQDGGFFRHQQAARLQFAPARTQARRARGPQQHLDVAQPAGTLLAVGLQSVGRFLVFRMALLLLEALGLKEGLSIKDGDDGARQFVKESARPGDQARFEQRREHRLIGAGFDLALRDCAHAVTQMQSHVP